MSLSHSPKIITDGLTMYLDAANFRSYPKIGAAWLDLMGASTNSGILTNGPTFGSNNGGCIVFDGTNDKVLLPNANSLWALSGQFSVSFAAKCDKIGNQFIFSSGPYGGSNSGINFWFGGGDDLNLSVHFLRSDINSSIGYGFVLPSSYMTNHIYHITYIPPPMANTNGSLSLYQDNKLIESKATTYYIQSSYMPNGWEIANTSSSYYLDGNVYYFLTYNKALNLDEVKQNFNSMRGRFGI